MSDIMISKFRGSTAVVTGAADGIGLAIAKALLDCGVNVASLDVNEKSKSEPADKPGRSKAALKSYCCDVSEIEELASVQKSIQQDMGDVSLLWVNAGVGIARGILGASVKNLRWMYGVNLWGAINTIKTFVPSIVSGSGPRHVGFTASSACLRQINGPSTAYAASKYAFWGVAESVRSELEKTDVGVSILYPSLTSTHIWNSVSNRPEKYGGPRAVDPESGERWQTGLSADSVAQRALEAIAADSTYCIAPTEETREDFDNFVSRLRSGFE